MLEYSIIEKGSLTDEEGQEIKLTYGLVTGKTILGELTAETYGVSICAESQGRMTLEVVEDISPGLNDIKALIQKLCQCQVTPVTLKDIINDYIEN